MERGLMNGPTHAMGGLAVGCAVTFITHSSISHAGAGIAISYCAGLLPDWIAISFPFVRLPLEGHRGFSHTLLFVVLTSWIIWQYSAVPWLTLFWFAGLLSHLLLDVVTVEGVPLFWPIIPHRVSLGWTTNGHRFEFVARIVLAIGSALLLFQWIVK
jgi:inner membrane protein